MPRHDFSQRSLTHAKAKFVRLQKFECLCRHGFDVQVRNGKAAIMLYEFVLTAGVAETKDWFSDGRGFQTNKRERIFTGDQGKYIKTMEVLDGCWAGTEEVDVRFNTS